MNPVDRIYASTWTASVVVGSGSALGAGASFAATGLQDTLVVPAPTAAVMTGSARHGLSHLHSNRARRPRWVGSGSTLPVPSMPASAAPTGRSAATPPASQPAPKAAKVERIELAIDSLHSYELIEPILVLIESLGDKVFLAEAPALNLSTTGNSVGAAFLLLKEHIITTYETYHNKKGLDVERARQLAVLEKYIGKAKRHWF